MRKFLLLSSAVLSMFAVGCVSAEDVCESGIDTTCNRIHECYTKAELDASGLSSVFGTSAADCKTKQTALAKCSEKKNTDELCTDEDAGKKYDLGNASNCADGIKKLSCADFKAAKFPAVCDQICK